MSFYSKKHSQNTLWQKLKNKVVTFFFLLKSYFLNTIHACSQKCIYITKLNYAVSYYF